MKQALRYALFFLAGLFLAGLVLYFYSQTFFNGPGGAEGSLPEVFKPAMPGEALITSISGEVYIIRGDQTLTPLPGDRVEEGDIIKVVDNSFCQVSFAGTASLKIRSNTLVKIQKLLSGAKDADIRTELLTGSMIYKVEELADSENLQILAQERIFRVEGTEFMIQALPGNPAVLSVLDGKVSVLQRDENSNEILIDTLTEGQKTAISPDDHELSITELSTEDSSVFAMESPQELPVLQDGLVFLEISTEPEGAQIYIDGRLNGSTRVKGLFLPEKELTILARKRGYRDKSMRIIPMKLEIRSFRIELTPLGLEETLLEEQSREDQNTVIETMKEKHLQEIADLRRSFTQKLSATETETEKLRRSETFLAQENLSLEEELARSREETRKLKDLIRQIQDLAEDQ